MLTLLDTELDLLELRLRDVVGIVDRVVVFESRRTSTGKAKDLYLKRAWKHFEPYHHMLAHYTSDDLELDSWKGMLGLRGKANERLSWARNEMYRRADAEYSFQPDDLIILADADELQWREAVRLVKSCDVPTPLEFKGPMAENGLGRTQRMWHASLTVTVRDIVKFGGGKLDTARNRRHLYPPVQYRINVGSFHCSWCFKTTYLHYRKAMSFTHHDRYDPNVHVPSWWCTEIANQGGLMPTQPSLTTPAGLASPVACWAAEVSQPGSPLAEWVAESSQSAPVWAPEAKPAELAPIPGLSTPPEASVLPVPLLAALQTEAGRARFGYLVFGAATDTCPQSLQDSDVSHILV